MLSLFKNSLDKNDIQLHLHRLTGYTRSERLSKTVIFQVSLDQSVAPFHIFPSNVCSQIIIVLSA